MLTARDITALVEAELAQITPPALVARIRALLVPPRGEERPWDYGSIDQTYPCWIVAEHPESNTAFASCAHGFGPGSPWGLLAISGPHTTMGMDSEWFTFLEDCVRRSAAWEREGLQRRLGRHDTAPISGYPSAARGVRHAEAHN